MLRAVPGDLRVAGADGRTLAAAQRAADRGAQQGADDSAAHRGVGRRIVGSAASGLHGKLPARRIVELELIECHPAARHGSLAWSGRKCRAAGQC